ncbi:MAG: hypothetical protein COV07_00680 [Candidatus Vogelbacteria bacterium CG10_big_fil_rev_8_21_14_0_10_45_14]|uniref:DUF5050 domain-containing protein n=1 Tax=Candidatus Vogelbacteria bacterium CG10_big_fil_rev_8_21_14_0_10_45_14 TaxID=1975042 RepID=A0A2H0RMG1_9BACT|nr:MAG: hypothetical protein COV07_00680 [Candidatus Vogelbacteria bacterium CG10_big_fil_rev_8_21_14_0_10_45_14]
MKYLILSALLSWGVAISAFGDQPTKTEAGIYSLRVADTSIVGEWGTLEQEIALVPGKLTYFSLVGNPTSIARGMEPTEDDLRRALHAQVLYTNVESSGGVRFGTSHDGLHSKNRPLAGGVGYAAALHPSDIARTIRLKSIPWSRRHLVAKTPLVGYPRGIPAGEDSQLLALRAGVGDVVNFGIIGIPAIYAKPMSPIFPIIPGGAYLLTGRGRSASVLEMPDMYRQDDIIYTSEDDFVIVERPFRLPNQRIRAADGSYDRVFVDGDAFFGTWAHDGESVFYISQPFVDGQRLDGYAIFRKWMDGRVETIVPAEDGIYYQRISASPDGGSIVLQRQSRQGHQFDDKLVSVSLVSGIKSLVLVETSGREIAPSFATDGTLYFSIKIASNGAIARLRKGETEAEVLYVGAPDHFPTSIEPTSDNRWLYFSEFVLDRETGDGRTFIYRLPIFNVFASPEPVAHDSDLDLSSPSPSSDGEFLHVEVQSLRTLGTIDLRSGAFSRAILEPANRVAIIQKVRPFRANRP